MTDAHPLPPPEDTYLAMAAKLKEIADKCAPHLSTSENMLLGRLANIELPAIEDMVQAATFTALTTAHEAVQIRRQNRDLQESNSRLHLRVVELQARLRRRAGEGDTTRYFRHGEL